MIEIGEVSKKFGRLQVLKNVNLQCLEGESIALLGPNGCGKTTLIKSILNMVLPDSGRILFDKKDIRQTNNYRKHIGYMPQIGRYPDNMTVGQVIQIVQDLRHSNTLDTSLYEQFKIKDILEKRMATLSGGTRQKVSAVLAFMFDAKVLILDEPTAGLDPLASEILKEKIILEKKKGKLILITSHILSELDDLVSEIVFMQEGKIRFQKKTAVLKEETEEKTIGKAIAHLLKKQENE